MKKIKVRADITAVTVVIFIVCIVLVSVMLMQFRTIEQTDITEIESMRESELRVALSEWKTKYEDVSKQLTDINSRIEDYNKTIEDNDKASELIDEELNESNTLVGKTNVYGEGVIITIKSSDTFQIYSDYLLELVNELRYAGAEAISINGVRILTTTEIVDFLSYISVNQQRLEEPYVIKAIGDSEYMYSILNLKGSGFADIYLNQGMNISVVKEKKVEIPKSDAKYDIKYMTEDKEQE